MPRLAALACLCFLLLAGTAAGAAEAPPGDFILEEGALRPQVSTWGADCGPEPVTETFGPGTRYAWDGILGGRGTRRLPLFAPGICKAATQQPELAEQRDGAGRFLCKSPAGASKSIEGEVTLAAESPDRLVVLQAFRYDWSLKGSRCVVATSARFVLRRADAPVAVASAASMPASVTAKCALPGPPATLAAVGGTERVVPAGGRVRLSVRLADAAGCPATGPVVWLTSAGTVEAGVVDVRGVAPGGSVTVTATLGEKSVAWRVRVARDAADLAALVAAQPELREGEMAPLPPQIGEGMTAGAGSSVAGEGSTRARWLMGLFVVFGVFAAGLAIYILVRTLRARRSVPEAPRVASGRTTGRPAPAGAPQGASPPAPTPPNTSPTPSGPPRQCPQCERTFDDMTAFCTLDATPLESARFLPGESPQERWSKVCPACRSRHPASMTRCPRDGAILVTPGSAGASGPAPRARICPRCGAQYGHDAEYCGRDGERLVLVN